MAPNQLFTLNDKRSNQKLPLGTEVRSLGAVYPRTHSLPAFHCLEVVATGQRITEPWAALAPIRKPQPGRAIHPTTTLAVGDPVRIVARHGSDGVLTVCEPPEEAGPLVWLRSAGGQFAAVPASMLRCA